MISPFITVSWAITATHSTGILSTRQASGNWEKALDVAKTKDGFATAKSRKKQTGKSLGNGHFFRSLLWKSKYRLRKYFFENNYRIL
jgi:hypothetical protein